VKHGKAGLQTSSNPQNSASHLLGLQCLLSDPSLRYKVISPDFVDVEKRIEAEIYNLLILASRFLESITAQDYFCST
jgi:hypothetical protein